jgi:hypothetical protein
VQGLILYLVITFFPKFVGELGKGIMQFCISWAEGGHQLDYHYFSCFDNLTTFLLSLNSLYEPYLFPQELVAKGGFS